jgi:hypothetical protein
VRREVVKATGAEGTEYVMLDEAGPGAIVRFWAGGYINVGTVHIYIDGATEQAIWKRQSRREHPLFDVDQEPTCPRAATS